VQLLAQRPPFQQFRNYVVRGVLSADVVDREDIWVIQRRDGPRLLFESAQPI
jgi:hypothetical protein